MLMIMGKYYFDDNGAMLVGEEGGRRSLVPLELRTLNDFWSQRITSETWINNRLVYNDIRSTEVTGSLTSA
jgi:hypothetical protein